MNFFSTYGVEFSFLPSDIFYKSGFELDLLEIYTSVLEDKLKEWNKKNKLKLLNYLDCHDDDKTLEVSSPYFKNWDDMKLFYEKLLNITQEMGLKLTSEYTGSGGGHIHVGIRNKFKNNHRKLSLFMINLVRDLSQRPYLNALFNEYIDTFNANNFYKYKYSYNILKIKTAEKAINFHSGFYFGWNTKFNNILDKFSENTYVRGNSNYGTIEFRFFDMPRTTEELYKHIIFLNKYLNYILQKTNKIELVEVLLSSKKEFKEYCNSFKDINKTRKYFRRFLKEIGLEYDSYKYLFDRNFKDRTELDLPIN